MNIKPKAQIGDTVNIVKFDLIQARYRWNSTHLLSKMRGGKFIDYYVHDVEVIISLKTGSIEYRYLIGREKEITGKHFSGGWVGEDVLEPSNKKEQTA
ncbi:hypothetical protein IEN91_04935 [Bacillus velezensis]|uniref:hypothetical protein n=1 Tax=Bacillus velezensis TaxID=492670 RepID=UPI0018C6CB19|nr:hypothetical protein [Bacillus velezensis]QPK89789.1 hypothetical protein IEN91_04935 [Bacillus velezensis]